MGNSYIASHFHIVFATKYRRPVIAKAWRPRLHAYVGGILRSMGVTPLAVGGIEDHIHILCGIPAVMPLAEVPRQVKSRSTRWVRRELGLPAFGWQDGYGAFAVDRRGLRILVAYIARQEEHHLKQSSIDEFNAMLRNPGFRG